MNTKRNWHIAQPGSVEHILFSIIHNTSAEFIAGFTKMQAALNKPSVRFDLSQNLRHPSTKSDYAKIQLNSYETGILFYSYKSTNDNFEHAIVESVILTAI